MLKEYMVIQFNSFLADPTIGIFLNIGISSVLAVILAGFVSGTRKRVVITWAISTLTLFVLLQVASWTSWFTHPVMGIFGVAVLGASTSVGLTHVFAGLGNKKALYAGLASVGVGVALYYPLGTVMGANSNYLLIMALGLLMISSSYFIGYFFSNIDRGPVIRSSMLSATFVSLYVIVDRLMQAWQPYFVLSDGKPMQTDGAYNLTLITNDFWIVNLDLIAHLVLPTLALTLISFAGYLRYSRASLLEVMNMDYVRTARAKGMPEREVILRHAFRNAMLPITTLIAFDIAGIVGGAIITERVFSWRGMGSLANEAIVNQDLNLLMGTFALTAFLAVMATLAADLVYSLLDPRIRIRK
jgi:peptide/nickel transport system permease protein